MASINAKSVTDAIGIVAIALPQLTVAYSLLKLLWLGTNPGKTEKDFEDYLNSASQKNIDDTSAYLVARGFVETPAGSGNWTKV